MKRIYFGGILLAVLLAMSVVLTVCFTRLHEPVSRILEQAAWAGAAEDWERAELLTARARQQWTKYRDFTAAVADHGPLEQMEAMFFRLEVLLVQQQADEFAADSMELSRMAAAMAESQKLTWWSLL